MGTELMVASDAIRLPRFPLSFIVFIVPLSLPHVSGYDFSVRLCSCFFSTSLFMVLRVSNSWSDIPIPLPSGLSSCISQHQLLSAILLLQHPRGLSTSTSSVPSGTPSALSLPMHGIYIVPFACYLATQHRPLACPKWELQILLC